MPTIKINTKGVDNLIKDMGELSADAIKQGFKTFKDETPVAGGNAKRNTRLQGQKIRADYGYAGRLDEGWSKKAPEGMSKPAIKKIQQFVDAFIRKVG